MLVKVIEKYKDLEIGDIVPIGVLLDVNEARANVLKEKGKVIDYILPTKKENKPKVEEAPKSVEVAQEDIIAIEEVKEEEIPEDATIVDEVNIVDKETDKEKPKSKA